MSDAYLSLDTKVLCARCLVLLGACLSFLLRKHCIANVEEQMSKICIIQGQLLVKVAPGYLYVQSNPHILNSGGLQICLISP